MSISPQAKKWSLLFISILSIIALVGFAFGMYKREDYLKTGITRIQHKLDSDYQIGFHVKNYRFAGLSTVEFEDVCVIPAQRDTLASMRQFRVRVALWPLLFGDIQFGELYAADGKLSFVKRDSLSNYDFLFQKKEKQEIEERNDKERNFAETAERLFQQVFNKIPSDLGIQNFEISYQDSSLFQKLRVPDARIEDGDFETHLLLNDNEAEWILSGQINSDKKRVHVEVSSKEKDVELPFLKGKYGLSVSFDKLIFDLSNVQRIKKDLLQVDGGLAYENLKVNHHRLSDEPIILPKAEARGGLEISKNYISIKDKSSIKVKDFEIFPLAKVVLEPTKKLEISLHTGRFEAQHFFDALPKGLFESLDGIQVAGGIAYDLDFKVDFDDLDNIHFESRIDDTDLKVLRWGKVNIDSLNFPFVYNAFDDTTLVRQFVVGPDNPNFVPFDQIPYVLRTTVRNTEDPYFYKHNGFEEEAFKLSIATNIRERKFKRGASTISMQLVKNVFLNRKKTMNRKFEEILLVWLMESSSQVRKDRILEIYFNVIEWGKNIYGIKEAAQYYFLKQPADLTLGESLFLSSIIPRPKTGLTSFDHTGGLKPWVQKHFNTYGYIMNKLGELKEVVVPEGYGFYQVQLQSGLRPKVPAQADTSFLNIMEEHENAIRHMEQDERGGKILMDKMLDNNDN